MTKTSWWFLFNLLTMILGFSFSVKAQSSPTFKDSCFDNEINFVHYLADAGKTKLALTALNNINCSKINAQLDSINYLKGIYNFSLKELDAAVFNFLKVSEQSPMYAKSRFLAAYGLTYDKKLDNAKIILDKDDLFNANDSLLQQLRHLQLSGIYLLQRDTTATRNQISTFSNSFYSLADQQKQMSNNLIYCEKLPHKSAFVAGMFSAILPGSGRWYAGRKKQALGSFIQMLGLGLLTWEAYHKHGSNSVPFYLFGSAFTVFYLSNIYGSAIAVKIKQRETNTILDNKILLDLHIPLRSIFN